MNVNRRVSEAVLLAGALVSIGMLTNCGAARPTNYYVLDSGTSQLPERPATSPQFPVTLVVGRIITTHLYRDDRLVYGSGPVELGTYEYQRWAEPPAEMIQDIIVASLRATGKFRSVSRIASALRPDYIVRGRLIALYEVDKPMAARFSLELELFDPKSATTVWTDSYSHDEPVAGKKVADVVEALDANVRAGMARLTASLSQYFASRPQQVP
jgi:ABC-type uncharacterized transport system auxiliary subunit